MAFGSSKISDETNRRIVKFAQLNDEMGMAAVGKNFGVSITHVKRVLEAAGIDVSARTRKVRGSPSKKPA